MIRLLTNALTMDADIKPVPEPSVRLHVRFPAQDNAKKGLAIMDVSLPPLDVAPPKASPRKDCFDDEAGIHPVYRYPQPGDPSPCPRRKPERPGIGPWPMLRFFSRL